MNFDIDAEVKRCLIDCIDFICSVTDSAEKMFAKETNEEETGAMNEEKQEADDFCWETYLKSVGCSAANPASFWHIEQSLSIADLLPGHLVALTEEKFYWPAEIISTCHIYLNVKPFRSVDSLWQPVNCSTSIKPISVALRENLTLYPFERLKLPPGLTKIKDEVEIWMKNRNWAPENAFQEVLNILPYERIEIGQFVDVQNEDDPRKLWPCEILENLGGRLLLKYANAKCSSKTFWSFYLSERIHPAGIINKCNYSLEAGWKYVPPDDVEIINNSEEVQQVLQNAKENSIWDGLFETREPLEKHNFELHMKLEALHPVSKTQFFPASVVEVLNNYYFVIELDCSLLDQPQANVKKVCHKSTEGIFPVNWCAEHRLRLGVPDKFDWTTYTQRKGGKMTADRHFASTVPPTPDVKFYRGQKLEAVNPMSTHQICVATVVRVVHPLLWIHLDSLNYLTSPYAVHVKSTDLYPCGWCQSVCYSVKWPVFNRMLSESNAKLLLKTSYGFISAKRDCLQPSFKHMREYFQPEKGCEWSPSIYINPKCYTGPYIDHERLQFAPKEIASGPLYLVLNKVLCCLITAANKPRDIFAEFQSDQIQPSNPDREMIEIKAKYYRKTTKGNIEICKKMNHVQEWCRQLCTLLEACPSLVALYSLNDGSSSSTCTCPYNCTAISNNKPFSVIKSISMKKQLKIKKRKATRNSHYENDGQPLIKRSRRANISFTHHNRPLTRGAQLPSFKPTRPRRNVQPFQPFSSSQSVNGVENGMHTKIRDRRSVADLVDAAVLAEVAKKGQNGTKVDFQQPEVVDISIPPILTNPFHWTPVQLYQWLINTEICKNMARKLREEDVDGQAFMLLDLQIVQKALDLKLGPALKLCAIIKHLKLIYTKKYSEKDLNGVAEKELDEVGSEK